MFHWRGQETHALFFFSSRRRHTRSLRDWSSDVCSSDLCKPSVIPATPRSAEPLRPARTTRLKEGGSEPRQTVSATSHSLEWAGAAAALPTATRAAAPRAASAPFTDPDDRAQAERLRRRGC